MERIAHWWMTLTAREPNWDLILKFLDVLIWPMVVVAGLVAVRPWRIVDAMIANGGEFAVAGSTIRLSKKIEEVSVNVEQDEETTPVVEAPINNPANETSDAYTMIMNGWSKVIQGLEDAVREASLEPLRRQSPMRTVTVLRERDLIGRKIQRAIEDLWDVRNRVKRAGSSRLARIGISLEDARDYYVTAERVRRGIGRAIALRESRGQLGDISTPKSASTQDGVASTAVH